MGFSEVMLINLVRPGISNLYRKILLSVSEGIFTSSIKLLRWSCLLVAIYVSRVGLIFIIIIIFCLNFYLMEALSLVFNNLTQTSKYFNLRNFNTRDFNFKIKF